MNPTSTPNVSHKKCSGSAEKWTYVRPWVMTLDMQMEALLHERAEAGVSLRTSTPALIGACSYRRVDSVRRLSVGRVLVVNDPVDITSRSTKP